MNLHEQAISELAYTGNALLSSISSFDEENFNRKRNADEWSAGQITEHLLKSNKSILKILSIDGLTASRKPDLYVPQLKAIMEDMVHKTKSVDFLLPADQVIKEGIASEFRICLGKILKQADQKDLTIIPDKITFPNIGALTKLEWIFFAGFHIKRHSHQMYNLNHLSIQNNSSHVAS